MTAARWDPKVSGRSHTGRFAAAHRNFRKLIDSSVGLQSDNPLEPLKKMQYGQSGPASEVRENALDYRESTPDIAGTRLVAMQGSFESHRSGKLSAQCTSQNKVASLSDRVRKLSLGAYYFAKPVIPWRLRIGFRRLLAKPIRRQFSESWPISPAAGRAPEGFPGWPDGKKFAFVLTHDVETKIGLDQCRELAEMEIRMGFRSSFNFIPEGDYATPESLRNWLTANGFEVGVHDLRHNGKLYHSRQRFAANAHKINRYLREWKAMGFRSAFMLHNLRWIQDLRILYDASTFDTDPFEPQPDGVNTIFPLWISGIEGPSYVELPYTLPQDSTLYLTLQETSIDIWKQKLDWIAQHGGMALVIIHPDYISFDDSSSSSRYGVHLYREFLEYVASRYGQQCWFALPRDVARYIHQWNDSEGTSPRHGSESVRCV